MWISIQSFSSIHSRWQNKRAESACQCECMCMKRALFFETSRTFTQDLALFNLSHLWAVFRGPLGYFCFVWRLKTSFWCLRFGIFHVFLLFVFFLCYSAFSVVLDVRVEMIFGIVSKTNENLVVSWYVDQAKELFSLSILPVWHGREIEIVQEWKMFLCFVWTWLSTYLFVWSEGENKWKARCFSFAAKKHTQRSLVWEAFPHHMKLRRQTKSSTCEKHRQAKCGSEKRVLEMSGKVSVLLLIVFFFFFGCEQKQTKQHQFSMKLHCWITCESQETKQMNSSELLSVRELRGKLMSLFSFRVGGTFGKFRLVLGSPQRPSSKRRWVHSR